ncbi:hypothetical protein FGF1_41040 [Flavobacteriaceae bacterium GF1]
MAYSGTKLYNGNISETEWRTANTDNTLKWYRYGYDALNRLTSAVVQTGHYNMTALYDKNGNITELNRNGHTNATATTFGPMDRLGYSYDAGNKLTKVLDIGRKTYGFTDSTTDAQDYWYDANGNMVRDLNKGIGTASVDGISYNHLNLPTEVKFDNSSTKKITYIYDALGTKLKKMTYNNGVSTTTDYAGNYVYENATLQFFPHPEGYVTPNGSGGYDYVYNHIDHLGNVRLSYTDANNDGSIDSSSEIIEENNYYPLGLKMRGFNSNVSPLGNSVAKRYKYNNKELQDELGLGWYDLGARNYDPTIGRFFNVDPLAEDYSFQSVYAFAANNPISFVDINGEGVLDDFHIYEDGSILRIKTDDATDTFIFHNSNGNQHDIATLEKNENGLINAPNIDYDSGDGTSVSVSSKPGNESEINISGTALASVIGASADSGEEIYITRASNADGSSPGSNKTHKGGKNIDIRFAGQNGSRERLDFEVDINDFT